MEALELFLALRAKIREVVTDLMMPVRNGPALIRALRDLDPRLPVLGMTGLPDRVGVRGFDELELVALLPKPFASRDLLAGLKSALGAMGERRDASRMERTGGRETGAA